MRLKGWETRLKLVIEKHMALPLQWGVSDCYIIVDDAVQALTGDCLYSGATKYKTEKGAAKILAKHGFRTVHDALAGALDQIPVSMAQRGDVGVVYQQNGDVSGGVFTPQGFMSKSQFGVEFLPLSSVYAAYRVG